MSEAPAPRRSGWWLFAGAAASGLVLSFCFFLGIMLGDCIPRDGSAAMRACDASAKIGLDLYPLLVIATFVLAFMIGWRRRGWGIALAAATPFIALAILFAVIKLVAG